MPQNSKPILFGPFISPKTNFHSILLPHTHTISVSSNNKNVPEWSSLEVLFLCIEKVARWTNLFAFPRLYSDGKIDE